MDKENEAHYPLVLVTWVDCTTFRGWHNIKASLEFMPDEVETVGFLLSEEETGYLRITPTMSSDKDGETALLDVMTIPRSWVTKVEVLGLVSSCGCGESMMQEKLNEEDCWGAPDPEPEGIVIPVGQQVVLEIKGDEALGRQLTFDEHIRRGGTFDNWNVGE